MSGAAPERSPQPPTERKSPTTGYDFAGELLAVTGIANTPASPYLASRDVPPEVAHVCGVRYSPTFGSTVWTLGKDGERRTMAGAPAVVFPLRNADGKIVGMQGRVPGLGTFWTGGPNKRTFKLRPDENAGAFFAPPDALKAQALAVVEAPIDALSLRVCRLPTVATGGTGCPDWLIDALAFRAVFLAQDHDEAGERAAARLAGELRSRGSRTFRLRPPEGTKDWNEALQTYGRGPLTSGLFAALCPYLPLGSTLAEEP